jgi:hypothetical protein
MPSPTLLADLTLRLASSPEDVATEALTLILGRSRVAASAVNLLVERWQGGQQCGVTRWKSQVSAADDARTDMEGEDANGVTCVIFENKFDAALTLNQPGAYLRRLPSGYGVLAFVAPSRRLTALQIEVVERASLAGFGAPEFRASSAGRVAKLATGHTLVVTSWEVILSAIATAADEAQDHAALADIRQLQGLAERMDAEAFLPLTAEDITGPMPRRVMQLCEVVNQAWTILSRQAFISTKGVRVSAGAGWYGPYMFIHGFGCQMVFSAERWAKFGVSPIWLRVASEQWKFPDGLQVPLAQTLPDPIWMREEERGSWPGIWLPIRLLEGREMVAVVDDVVGQVGRVADVLARFARSTGDPKLPEEPPVNSQLP